MRITRNLLATTAMCTFATIGTANAASGDGVGAFMGGGTPDAFGTWLGNTMTVGSDFLNASGWTAFETLVGSSSLSTWVTWENALPGRRLVTYGIPPYAWGVSANYTACASGSYNTHWANLAHNVINSGLQHLDLRVAWEFDGDWTIPDEYFPNGDFGHFVGCWQQIVNTVHAIDTNHVITFDWNPTAGCCNYLDERYWPGDSYVDYVGFDLYDTQSLAATDAIFTQIVPFAQRHGKKITFPEWGVWEASSNNGRGDDPSYIQKMYDFMSNAANNVAWSNYFDISGDADHRLDNSNTQFPNSSALYKSLFKSPYQQPVSMWPTSNAVSASPSGTTTPPANQIVDSTGKVWTVSNGQPYVNGVYYTGADVSFLLYYNGVVYADTNSNGWFISSGTGTWTSIAGDPRPASTSPSGTTTPFANQIVDSSGKVWTTSGGFPYVNGTYYTGADVSYLLYYNGTVYADTNSNGWFVSSGTGTWTSIAGDPRPATGASISGTTTPPTSQIVDSNGKVWTVSNGQPYVNGVYYTGADVKYLLYYNGVIYADTNSNGWFVSSGTGTWTSIAADPRP